MLIFKCQLFSTFRDIFSIFHNILCDFLCTVFMIITEKHLHAERGQKKLFLFHTIFLWLYVTFVVISDQISHLCCVA